MADYGVLKTLHVIGAVLLVGNVTVTGVWALLMYRARAEVPFRPVARAILWTDLLTLSGGAMLTITGILMIRQARLPWLEMPWLLWGISALVASTLVWLVMLLPDQVRMARPDAVIAIGHDRQLAAIFASAPVGMITVTRSDCTAVPA